jgi:hypothetical protein
MTCTRVQTVRARTSTPSVHTHVYRPYHSIRTCWLYRSDDPFRTNVHSRLVDANSCTRVQPASLQMYSCVCGRVYACRTIVRSDSFAMHSSTKFNYLASSGLTFEIMCFGSNTGRIFNHHLPEAHSNPKIPSSRWTTQCRDKNLDRPRGPPLKPFTAGLPEVVRLAHVLALASPADRTCKLPAWLYPKLIIKKGQPRTGAHRTSRVIRCVQLCIANGV